MPRALTALRAAIRQVSLYLGLMLVTNIVAIFLTLPILVAGVLIAAVFHSTGALVVGLVVAIGILPSPSNAGLQFVAHETASKNPVLWRDQIDGLRHYSWPALRVWIVSLIVSGLLAANILYYSHSGVPFARSIEIGWLSVSFCWLSIHLYVYPLILVQEQKRLLLIYRNAALIAFSRPGFTVVTAVVWFLVLTLMSLSGLIGIIGLALCAEIQQNATAAILPTFDD